MNESEKVSEEPIISDKIRKGIRGVLIGPPGSGKGTQVLTRIIIISITMDPKTQYVSLLNAFLH